MSQSSERTLTITTVSSPNTNPNSLPSAHHFVSLKLTHRNYLYWRTQIIPFLRGQRLLGFIDGSRPCPSPVLEVSAGDSSDGTPTTVINPAHEAWIEQDASILSLLISSISEEVMYLTLGQTTSREVWLATETALGSSSQVRCLNLMGQFQSLRQGDASTQEYLGRAQHLVEDLALAGRTMTLSEQNLYVFRGLRTEFRSMAASLAVSGTPVTIPQLADYLQAQQFIHEDDFPVQQLGMASGQQSALYAGRGRWQNGDGSQRGGQSRGGGGQSRGGGNRRGGRGRGNQRGGGVRCQICRSQGHSAAFCYKRYSEPPPSQAHVAVAGNGSVPAVTSWLPDTGASAHATPDSGALGQSTEYHGDEVLRVGNGSGLVISRVGYAVIPSVSKSLKLIAPRRQYFLRDQVSGAYTRYQFRSHITRSSRLVPLPWSGTSVSVTHMANGVPSEPNAPWASSPVAHHGDETAPALPPPNPIGESQPEPQAYARTRRRAKDRPQERNHVMRLRHQTRGAAEEFHALTASIPDPTCYSQAVGHSHWRDAMDQEFNALLHNCTWQLVPATSDMNIVGCKWVFRTKRKADGTIERYKARLVAKGFNQVAGEDFFETFSPVVKPTTVRILLSLAVSRGWTLRQLDVHNAFLNGRLSETVYMRQPPGYEDPDRPTHVCHLQRSLYGLKQAPRAWFKRLHDFLLHTGFVASKTDVSLFHYLEGDSRVFLLVYVDDIIMLGDDDVLIDRLLSKLATAFKIRDLGTPTFFLGIETLRVPEGMLLTQRRYMHDILQ
ncbi:PREDICTED: uncharacterized protein LOC109173090 [Ipomoea nil]|uniref:uncharacterized protein LOC109173090 n=1 Tax=Ipomoea nil TaxID=35883 RepID=UPI00090104F2|nr:PREDICTED: uncharacterized protein LOC109173090 [Ipomoea nil]